MDLPWNDAMNAAQDVYVVRAAPYRDLPVYARWYLAGLNVIDDGGLGLPDALGRAFGAHAMQQHRDALDGALMPQEKIEEPAFSAEDRRAGWPEAMSPEQVAALQRPYAEDDEVGGRAWDALHSALLAACDSGQLPAESQTVRVVLEYVQPRWTGDVQTMPKYAEPLAGDEPRYSIAPAAFAVWLHAQDAEPSAHVAAWFKAKAVAWPLVVASGADAAAPAAALAVLGEGDVTNFETLARYRLQFKDLPPQQRPPWTPEHVAIARRAVQAHGRGGNAAVARRLGMSASGLGDMFRRHPVRDQVASPFPGIEQRCKAA